MGHSGGRRVNDRGPGCLVLVTGTGTEIGKTWFAAAVLRALRARYVEVAACKPVQSFEPGAGPTDAEVLAGATGQDLDDVCPPHRRLPLPLAPPMAAEALGLPPFAVADLAREALRAIDARHVTLVESAGGPRSPLAADGDTVDLAAALDPDVVVLVADAGLGTINAVRLCAAALAGVTGPAALVVALNRYDEGDDLHRRNRDWLREHEGLEVVTDPEALASLLLQRPRRTSRRTDG